MANERGGGNRPVYTIKSGRKTMYAREVEILGRCRLVYNGKKLKCGARAWIETNSDIVMYDEMTYADSAVSQT